MERKGEGDREVERKVGEERCAIAIFNYFRLWSRLNLRVNRLTVLTDASRQTVSGCIVDCSPQRLCLKHVVSVSTYRG